MAEQISDPKNLKERRGTRSGAELLEFVARRLEASKPLRSLLEPWGRISIDRQLPFLTIFRQPDGSANYGDERFVKGEASYVIGSGARRDQSELSRLVSRVADTLADKFGAFLLLEVWVSHLEATGDMQEQRPRFRIHLPSSKYPQARIEILVKSLQRIRIQRQSATVEVVTNSKPYPPGMHPLVSKKEALDRRIFAIGIEVFDVYRDSQTNEDFPLMLQVICREFSRALKRVFFEFTQMHTSYRPVNYKALGRRSLVKSVWEVDEQLANISRSFDLVLAATPTNFDAAFEQFKRCHFEQVPQFFYRPVVVEPYELKKQLYSINIERVEDPALAHLFRVQQQGLDRQITMLADRGTSNFFYGSMQLYGVPDQRHVQLARQVLDHLPARAREPQPKENISATEFAEYARQEIDYYKQRYSDFASGVEVRDDIAGVMVSDGNLLISRRTRIARNRINALLQHEVGTHVVTYNNGKTQPFKQLCTGLIGYDELQEGLAVLAEYLSDGLTRQRLRMLAARVIAVSMLLDGATFIDTFRELVDRYRFQKKLAFNLVMRVYRAGGFTKDAIYLRGLVWLLDYLRDGGSLRLLWSGKMPQNQLALMLELRWRDVLKAPAVFPRYMDDPEALKRLDLIRAGTSLADLSKSVMSK